MNIIYIILLGIIFGLLIIYSGINRYNIIIKLALFKDFTLAKTFLIAIALGMILLISEIFVGHSSFIIKPLYTIAIPLGGAIFGIGMGILGYFPAVLPVSIGQGFMDSLIGIIGGIVGGVIFSLLFPFLYQFYGDNLGEISLFSILNNKFSGLYIFITCIIAILMIATAFWLHYIDIKRGIRSKNWIFGGCGLAIICIVLFYSRWLGVSLETSFSYPYIGLSLTGYTNNVYFEEKLINNYWQIWFMLGILIAGFFYSTATQTFKFRTADTFWLKNKGIDIYKRFTWAFIGGFLLIFGACIADGCTCGHIISGMMQLSLSSYIFTFVSLISFFITAHLMFREKKRYRK